MITITTITTITIMNTIITIDKCVRLEKDCLFNI